MLSALERWQSMIDARAHQMDTAYAHLGRDSADFWDRRARGFHRATKDLTTSDPFYLRLREALNPGMRVLDVGAGTGRFSLPLAELAQQVTVVEPNASMLGYLRQDAAARHLSNITYIQTGWETAPDDVQADLVICSHVLYPIRDIVPFLSKLLHATLHTCFIYMRGQHFDELTSDLWRHFHAEPRYLSPSYIHALDVLYEMGVYAHAEIVRAPQSLRYPSLDIAVEEQLEQLILPNNDATRAELHALLSNWLIERDGALILPQEYMVSAILRIDASDLSPIPIKYTIT